VAIADRHLACQSPVTIELATQRSQAFCLQRFDWGTPIRAILDFTEARATGALPATHGRPLIASADDRFHEGFSGIDDHLEIGG
jgi:hypothetical protein